MTDLGEGSRVHLIAIGGSAMHNLAVALQEIGMLVSGSDDEIYEPALSRLRSHGILPEKMGWDADCITQDIDAVILGMHAKIDNLELKRAIELGLKIYSYPEFIHQQARNKKRVVVAGSHGKTSTTAMIMHGLKHAGMAFDYLVGAQLEGFDTMVKLSEAPVIVIEGDEYLSSAIDRVPKIHHYNPHLSVLTGIAWDHINVFPTFENYIEQFRIFLDKHEKNSELIYYEGDENAVNIVRSSLRKDLRCISYRELAVNDQKDIIFNDKIYPFSLIGQHNLQNANAAMITCEKLGIPNEDFLSSLSLFKGASKRLQSIYQDERTAVFMDFAHAPSKVVATTKAVKDWYPDRKLTAILELHTFSSLNKEFLPQYGSTLSAADEAIVYYDAHTLKMKNMPDLSSQEVADCFNHPNLMVIHDRTLLHNYLDNMKIDDEAILLMTSGNFGNYDFRNRFSQKSK